MPIKLKPFASLHPSQTSDFASCDVLPALFTSKAGKVEAHFTLWLSVGSIAGRRIIEDAAKLSEYANGLDVRHFTKQSCVVDSKGSILVSVQALQIVADALS